MRNLLAIVVVLVVIAAVAGWYFGWYSVERTTPTDGHEKIEIDVNKDKAKADIRRGEGEVKENWNKATGRVKSAIPTNRSTSR
jgi:cell division protein YceG involved in septum cleavage